MGYAAVVVDPHGAEQNGGLAGACDAGARAGALRGTPVPIHDHTIVEERDRVAARSLEQERQQAVDQATQPCAGHPQGKARRPREVLEIGLPDGRGVVGKESCKAAHHHPDGWQVLRRLSNSLNIKDHEPYIITAYVDMS
jgi:hypothetical protein